MEARPRRPPPRDMLDAFGAATGTAPRLTPALSPRWLAWSPPGPILPPPSSRWWFGSRNDASIRAASAGTRRRPSRARRSGLSGDEGLSEHPGRVHRTFSLSMHLVCAGSRSAVTRGLDPRDRVRELGDASVPFRSTCTRCSSPPTPPAWRTSGTRCSPNDGSTRCVPSRPRPGRFVGAKEAAGSVDTTPTLRMQRYRMAVRT